MKLFFLSFVSVIFFCQMVLAQKVSPNEFAIHLLPNVNSNQIQTLDLKKIKPQGKPLISQEEIWFYQKETHQFQISYTASDRIKQLNNAGGTKAFAVFVGDEAIYAGAFWKTILSSTFEGIVIDTYKAVGKAPYYSNTDFPFLTLDLGYPSVEYFKGTDLRSDSRIFKALEDAGKLYEEVALVVKCKKIVATGKRRPGSIFTFEIISITKGNFKDKEITFELWDNKLLPELDAKMSWSSGKNIEFNRDTEIILEISQQVGKEKPDWFLREYRKK